MVSGQSMKTTKYVDTMRYMTCTCIYSMYTYNVYTCTCTYIYNIYICDVNVKKVKCRRELRVRSKLEMVFYALWNADIA